MSGIKKAVQTAVGAASILGALNSHTPVDQGTQYVKNLGSGSKPAITRSFEEAMNGKPHPQTSGQKK